MYTQCPQCDSVYRVTGAHLKQAGGEVVCGECGARFDALDRLSDVYPQPSPPAVPPSPDVLPAERQAEDHGTEADESAAEKPGKVAELAEAAEEPPTADEVEPEESARDRGDTEIDTSAAQTGAGSGELQDGHAEAQELPSGETAAEDGVDSVDDGPETETSKRAEDEAVADEQESPHPDDGDHDDEEPTVNLDSTAEELFALEELPPQQMADIDDLEFSEGLPVGEPPEDADEGESELSGPPPELARRMEYAGKSRRPWLIGLAVAALLAAGVHSQHGVLMRYPAISPILESVYSVLGMSVRPAWEISAYRIVDSSASLDAAGDLQITVQYVNEGGFPQPYPVLRVSLENRWGDEIGSRELNPSYYVEDYASGNRSQPGEQVGGRAVISEPGLAAVGFRLDLCLQDESGQARCLSEQP
ncbi:MAG: zinc-ribbon domain-containing protein [Gammaproteobacteria bacterium]|nr:MAG: zinc-ribbon domain-containing protein [Gammaproteobacteria bacterium]